MSAVFYVEPYRRGLDRRVFRRMGCGQLEWAYYDEWSERASRSRFYGFANSEVPQNCVEVISA